jgi:hypothetical protein
MNRSSYPPSGTTYADIESLWVKDIGFRDCEKEFYVRHGDSDYTTYKFKHFHSYGVVCNNEYTIGGHINSQGCSISFLLSQVYLTKESMGI